MVIILVIITGSCSCDQKPGQKGRGVAGRQGCASVCTLTTEQKIETIFQII